MTEQKTLVLATRNRGKIAELNALLADFQVEVLGLEDFGPIPVVEEDGTTFEENALKKARFTARVLGLPALADDSGLAVEALGGQPGVHSARYAGGEGTDDEANNHKLLEALEGVENRKATFVCVMAIAVPSGAALVYDGRCNGTIGSARVGTGGFGYDPVFFYSPFGRTFAELTPEEKNQVSHRAKAMAQFRSDFHEVMRWIDLHQKRES